MLLLWKCVAGFHIYFGVFSSGARRLYAWNKNLAKLERQKYKF